VDQVARAERRMQVTAQAIDEFVMRVQELDATMKKKGIVQQVEPGLGSVIVRGNGDLAEVRLDLEKIPTSDVGQLGPRIVKAIRLAEQKAAKLRERQVQEIRDSISRE
jgi:DNA-binding protein YbaB